jgi:hypothetical protein
MKPHIDTLFKSKLEHYATPAPQHAWDRIEAGLSKPTDKKFWLKIAAGFLLMVAATWLAVNGLPENKPLAGQLPAEAESHVVMPEINRTIPLSQKELSPVTDQVKPIKRFKNVYITESVTPELQREVIAEAQPEVTEPIAAILDIEEPVAQPATGMVIVLTAEEVNAKYLVKTSEQEATSEQKKSSRLQRLAVMAHNLSNEDILGDLRDRKNELFAFNFRDNHERKN